MSDDKKKEREKINMRLGSPGFYVGDDGKQCLALVVGVNDFDVNICAWSALGQHFSRLHVELGDGEKIGTFRPA